MELNMRRRKTGDFENKDPEKVIIKCACAVKNAIYFIIGSHLEYDI